MPKVNNHVLPEWIIESLQTLCPAGRMTVSEWADSNRILDGRTSSMPGRWRTDYTPYIKGIMDAFTDEEIEEIIIVKPTQVGGTEAILNMIGYVVTQDPAPCGVVYPTDILGKSISVNRIQPMIELCPELRSKYDANSPAMELQFAGMYLAIMGANSPSGLSSRPCRYLFMDEVDKYPLASGKEADPRSLARERTKTYDTNKKIVEVSTPTFDKGPIWQDWESADTQMMYFVTCPHCGNEWTFKFKQLKFDSKKTPEAARKEAVYICEDCDCVITDQQKPDMVKQGRWKAIRQGGKKRVAFRFNTFYSPWIRFGEIAYEFLRSYKVPKLHMNFINSWLAEPYRQIEGELESEKLIKRQSKYTKGVVPLKTVMLTGGVDVQKDSFFLTIRAWLPDMTSQNIYHEHVCDFDEVEHIMNVPYYDENGKEYVVNFTCMDSGYRTDEVYDFCLRNKDWCIAIKGSSNRMNSRYSLSTINKEGSSKGMLFCMVDTNYYKDSFYSRCYREDSRGGGFYLYKDTDPEYVEMLTAEHKVIKPVNKKLTSVWVLKQEGADNHYLDCEIYAAVAADLCGMRSVSAQNYREQKQNSQVSQPQAAVQPETQDRGTGYFSNTNSGGGGYWR